MPRCAVQAAAAIQSHSKKSAMLRLTDIPAAHSQPTQSCGCDGSSSADIKIFTLRAAFAGENETLPMC